MDYIRRVTFNISRVAAKTSSALTLAPPLIANPVVPGMSVQRVIAFVDREGSSFFQEWSGLFVVPADSGGRACFYYPRLQVAAGGHETRQELAAPLFSHMLHASLHALPTTDANDGETVLCYRSYFPAKGAAAVLEAGAAASGQWLGFVRSTAAAVRPSSRQLTTDNCAEIPSMILFIDNNDGRGQQDYTAGWTRSICRRSRGS